MAKFLSKYILAVISFSLILITTLISSAENLTVHEYVDFSSDRSTWFFRINGGDNKIVFSDFFFPYNPTGRTEIYDPLIKYELDNSYYFSSDNLLMISLEDLKKLYAPYFDFKINNETLSIGHTVYDKALLSGSGGRLPSMEYIRKVWSLIIELDNKKSGILAYAEYEPARGGRRSAVKFSNNIKNSFEDKKINFKSEVIHFRNKTCFVSIAEIMNLMGKNIFNDNGYLHVQSKSMEGVTTDVDRSDGGINVPEITVPNAGNPWHGGTIETFDKDYTWADYMNDVADGQRKTGWLWKAFYIPSGDNFVDPNGKKITLKADRIIPYNIYVPSSYDSDKTKLLLILHGGSGNENTQTYRIMLLDIPIDQYAEIHNYILVSPNGWTQPPMWREGQALYSFMKSAELTLEEYRINKDKVFITGNSMGGKGTLEIVMRYPEMFQAMAPTAPKITDRIENKNVINFVGTKYDLDNVSDIPTFIAQGTADTTTTFKNQIGNKKEAGAIFKAVMPKLNNALYLAVEGGGHSYPYGSLLIPIFEFFESTLKPYKNNFDFDTLYLSGKSTEAYLDGEKFELSAIESINSTVMLPMSDLEKIYGEGLKVYKVSSHHRNRTENINYYTVIYNKASINFHIDNAVYRRNMERYKEDAIERSKNSRSRNFKPDTEFLESAPRFSTAPYEKSGEIFVPVKELMAELGRKVVIN